MFSAEVTRDRVLLMAGRRPFLAGIAAVVGALGCYLIADSSGQELSVTGGGTEATSVPPGAVVLATVVAWAAALGLAAVARRARRPRLVFYAVAASGLIVTSIPPIAAATDAATAGWLLAMHAIVAACVVPAVAWSLPSQRDEVAGSAPQLPHDRQAPGPHHR